MAAPGGFSQPTRVGVSIRGRALPLEREAKPPNKTASQLLAELAREGRAGQQDPIRAPQEKVYAVQ